MSKLKKFPLINWIVVIKTLCTTQRSCGTLARGNFFISCSVNNIIVLEKKIPRI